MDAAVIRDLQVSRNDKLNFSSIDCETSGCADRPSREYFWKPEESTMNGVACEPIRCAPLLNSTDWDGIVNYIKTKKPKNIIVLTGAGISTSAGIPDFRTPGARFGLYDNLNEYDLGTPQDVFDIGFFNENPKPFFKLAKALLLKKVEPTPTHYFVCLLEKKGMLLRWFTQNIDSLEYSAGVSGDKVVMAHGNHSTSTCRNCKRTYDRAWITKHLEDPSKLVAYCEGCGGVVKPDIIFFDELLTREFFEQTIQDFPHCDLLIIMGTSLVVQPFASLVDEVHADVPRLLINRDSAGPFGVAYEDGISNILDCNKHCNRDVFYRGDCDDGVRELAEKLGWAKELEELIAQGPITSVIL